MGVITKTLIPSHRLGSGKGFLVRRSMTSMRAACGEIPMVYSYTQISQYLRCPRSYRYRYLDGWREKATRAAMVFRRSFEKAPGALFRREDPGASLLTEWGTYGYAVLEYKKGETWDRLVHQGIHLLEHFAQ